jgi:hypothetical protein
MGLNKINIGTVSGSVTVTPNRGTLTNRSGSITTGATAQSVAVANTNRKYLFFQNISAEDMWINFDGTAAVADQPSILFPTKTSMTWNADFCPTGAISVIAATTGSKFVCKEA